MEMANSIVSSWNQIKRVNDRYALHRPYLNASIATTGNSAIVQRSDGSFSATRGSAYKWFKRHLHARKNMLRSRDEGRLRLAYLPWVQQVCRHVRRFYFARKPPQCAQAHRWLSYSRFGMHSALSRDSSCIGRELILHHHSAKVITINLITI